MRSLYAGLRSATLLKKRLWHRCFPVNFVKFLRTHFLQNTSGRLLLKKLFQDLDVYGSATFNNGKFSFSFYENAIQILALRKLDICKWLPYSKQLKEKIYETEKVQSFDLNTTKKILGINWNLQNDKFVFTFDKN